MPVDRDRVVCKLANKAANTHRAIAVLCDAQLADDAYALARVLMENAIVLAWMCHRDWVNRVDAFDLFEARLKERLTHVITTNFKDTPEASQAQAMWDGLDREALVSEAMYSTQLKWACMPDSERPGKLKTWDIKEMFTEVDPAVGPIAHALSFSDTSHFIHSTVWGIRNFKAEIAQEDVYRLSARPRSEQVRLALMLSSTWMLVVINTLDQFTGAGLEPYINELGAELKAFQATRRWGDP